MPTAKATPEKMLIDHTLITIDFQSEVAFKDSAPNLTLHNGRVTTLDRAKPEAKAVADALLLVAWDNLKNAGPGSHPKPSADR